MFHLIKPRTYSIKIADIGNISETDLNAYLDIFEAREISSNTYSISETPTNLSVLRLKLDENSVAYEIEAE